jgi:hypothetical protein
MNKETPIGVFKNAEGDNLLIVSGTEEDIAAMDMEKLKAEFGETMKLMTTKTAIEMGILKLPSAPPPPVLSGKALRRERRKMERQLKTKTK